MKSLKSFLVSVLMLSLMGLVGCGDGGNDIPFIIPPANTTFSVTTASLPAATVGTAYTQTLAAANGTTPYTWAVTTGTLPAGLTLIPATGVISGTPTTAATSNFTVTVTDSTTPTAKTATKALSIIVNPAPVLTITTTTLPAATVGTAYSQTLAASNGTTPYTWAVTVGTLPTGLTINPTTGVISGTPTTAATSNFTVTVTDSAAATDTQVLSITVGTVVVPLAITTTSPLPAATFGAAYSQTLLASGGTTPYTWAVTVGTLPTGLTINPTTGVISGTPTAPAVPSPVTSNFTARVTDAILGTASTPFAITTSLSASSSAGKTRYDGSCAGCHRAGIYDTAGGPDLGTVTQATINAKFAGGASHNGITLTQPQVNEVYDFVSLY
jgi:hypothetical protein